MRGEGEGGGVGESEWGGCAGESKQRRHGAERFLARNRHRRSDVRENRRLEEASAERMAPASEQHCGALGRGVGDVALDLRDGRVVDERTLRCARLETRRRFQFLY